MNYSVEGAVNADLELDKRTYLPGVVVKGTCEHCGSPVEWDGSDDYLSYPTVGSPCPGYFYCENGDGTDDFCGENTPFWVQVDLVVSAAEPPPKGKKKKESHF